MTGRERILAAFRGEKVDFVPFAPNLYQWFYYHLANKNLPTEIAHAQHPFEVLRHLGAEILARWDTQSATRETYKAGKYTGTYSGETGDDTPLVTAFNRYPPGKSQCQRKFATPYGALTQTWAYTKEAGADFELAHWWKSWEDYPAVRFMEESVEYTFDAAAFHQWVERAGNDGVVMLHLTESPLKRLHWLAGPENASLFILDHPEEMQALARIHEKKALSLLESVVDSPDADIFVALDNLDSFFYSPQFYQEYCHNFFSQAAEIIHRRGKFLVVHACGRNRVLLPLAGRSGVDCLEGITPPPLGDVELHEARRLAGWENFTVNGGMDAPHQEIAADAETQLHQYTQNLFRAMSDKRHFIFASSCNTSYQAPWKNLVYFRDAAREYGRID